MELAFIQSILRSPSLPPNDPWLSGYAISYYHFGYILIAMFARLTGTASPVAFNLGISLIFGLTASCAYGLLYDLLHSRRKAVVSLFSPLLGPLFLLIAGNAEGFLEMLHSLHLFWRNGQSAFWQWLGIPDLNMAPTAAPTLEVRNLGTGSWWWWRASRVIMDTHADGTSTGDVINEFPFFSYFLADLHPHVLAMPFFLLAIALAFNAFRGGAQGWLELKLTRLPINRSSFLLAGLVLGGLGFLNTWDFPIAVAFFSGALPLSQYMTAEPEKRSLWSSLGTFLVMCLALILTGVALYLPFYLGFSSQAGGLIPNLVYQTRGAHFWVMFAPLMIPLFIGLVYWQVRDGRLSRMGRGFAWAGGIMILLWSFSLLLVAIARSLLPSLADLNPLVGSAGQILLDTFRASSWEQLLSVSWQRRFLYAGSLLTMVTLLGLTLGLFVTRIRRVVTHRAGEAVEPVSTSQPAFPGASNFVLVMVALGGLLVMMLEFVYLRDNFGYRINSVFKFYFQTWILWSLAAAYVFTIVWKEIKGAWGVGVKTVLLGVLLVSLVYPVYGFLDRIKAAGSLSEMTLDGSKYLAWYAPDELAAIQWLKEAPLGGIVEAISPTGGSYTDYARISEFSGNPTVLGWVGHEGQWRGGEDEFRSRPADVETLYTTRSWQEAQPVLEAYRIRYVIVGPRERSTYPSLNEFKFQEFLTPVFQSGEVTIYETPYR
jgi:YYY domain-containing protein